MASPRLICKSGYIDNPLHLLNILEYSGNKIASQQIIYHDGSVRNVQADDIITLPPAELPSVRCIRLGYKDGGGKELSYETYRDYTHKTLEPIRVNELTTIEDDAALLSSADGKQYHAIEDLNFFKYLDYVAERPGVEKEDGHGLFGFSGSGVTGNIPIEEARAMAEQYQDSRAWSHIISLDGLSAHAAGYDSRAAWKDLLIANAPKIARAYNISLENLVLNCAYHCNTDNPHAHLVFYSKDSREGFIKGGKPAMRKATEQLKSLLYNDIFKEGVRAVEIRKSDLRNELQTLLDKRLETCLAKSYVNPELEHQMLALTGELKKLPGKKQYGYLPAAVKALVDDILRGIIGHDGDFHTLFDSYCDSQRALISGYVINPDTIERKLAAFQNRFFHPGSGDLRIYHNVILACARQLAEAPQLFARTAKEEIVDFSVTNSSLSTVSSDAAPPPRDKGELPIPQADQEAPAAARTVRRKIADFDAAEIDMSTLNDGQANLQIQMVKPLCLNLFQTLAKMLYDQNINANQAHREPRGRKRGFRPQSRFGQDQFSRQPQLEQEDTLSY